MADLRVSFPEPCSEAWEAMAPADRARMCARCGTMVHDLAEHDLDEAEALLRAGGEVCVRAQVDAHGAVALRSSGARRMVIAAALSAGMAADSQPALAGPRRPQGSIAGTVQDYIGGIRVVATDAQGRRYSVRVHSGGRYRIRNLPAGTYTLTFHGCGEFPTVANVAVGDVQTVVPDPGGGGCIVVGLLRVEPDGHG